MREQVQREVAAFGDADRRADQGEPAQRGLADLLDPEEVDRIDVEPVGDRQHDVAQEHAEEHRADGQQDQRRR